MCYCCCVRLLFCLFPLSLPHLGCPLLKSIIPKILLYSYCFSAQEFKRTRFDPLFKSKLSLWHWKPFNSVQFSSVAQSCPALCDPMDWSMPDFPVHHQLQELTQTHVYRVSDAIQPSHPLLSPSPPAFNLSQLQGLFQWISSLHQVAKVLEFQLAHQSFQWIFRTDFL